MKPCKVIIYICRLIFIVNSIYLLFTMQFGSAFLLVVSLLLTFVPTFYKKWFKVTIPDGTYVIYVLFVICCQWLGTYLRFYDSLFWWDLFLHFSSGFILAYGGIVILLTFDKKQTVFKDHLYGVVALVAFAIGVTGAGLWEIAEFSSDQLFHTFTQLGSLNDTMEDIICGTVGSLLFAIYSYWGLHKNKAFCITKLLRLNSESER